MIVFALATCLVGSWFPPLTDIHALIAAATAKEPPVALVQERALAHARLSNARVEGLRGGAAWKAALPVLEVSGGYSVTRLDEDTILDEYSATDPWVIRGAGGNATEARVRLSWDLSRLAFNTEELDVQGLSGESEALLVRVTRLYGQRRRLLVGLRTAKDDDERIEKQLALDETTALLSGMTGGWFAEQLSPAKE